MRAPKTRRSLVLAFAATIAALGWVGVLAQQPGMSVGVFTGDPQPWYAGILSTVGILLWGAVIAMCTLVASVLRRTAGPADQIRFFAASAGIALLLLVDDWLQLHETLLPEYVAVDESIVSLAIGAIGLGYVVYVRNSIRQYETGLFVTAVLLAGASQALDLSHGFLIRTLQPPLLAPFARSAEFVEDGLKLLSIVAITAYFAGAAHSQLSARHGDATTAGGRPERPFAGHAHDEVPPPGR